jgi:protein-tyrosine phosphatase
MVAASSERSRFLSDEGAWQPNFHWFTDRLAVGGCFPPDRSEELASDHGFSAVIDLRQEACDDQRRLAEAGIDFLHLPTPDLHGPDIATLDRGVRFAGEHLDRGGKVLIHCQHGIGRSALLALCVMVDQGFEPLEALKQAKDAREIVSPSEAQYRGWARWLDAHGRAAPDYHTFGCIAYRHLANG